MKIKPKLSLSLVIGIVMIIIFIILLNNLLPGKYSEYFNFSKRSGIGISSYNISNKWHYKFHRLDGRMQGLFTAKDDDAKLIYSSNLEEGTVVFQLFNSADSLLVTFQANNTVDTLKGIFEKGERYRVSAIVTNAKGSFDLKME